MAPVIPWSRGRRDPDRRAHSVDRRLLRRGHDGAALPQGAQLGERDRAVAARGRPRPRSGSCTAVHRHAAGLLAAAAAEERRNAAPEQPEPAIGGSAHPGTASASPSAFENIALAHREIYALYEIAQSMGTSLGVADTMALISAKLAKLVPWSGCALYLLQPDTDSIACRFATRRRCAATAQHDAAARPRTRRLGCAEPADARECRPAHLVQSCRRSYRNAVAFGDRLSALSERRVDRLPGAVSHGREPLHGGPPAADRAHRRAGRTGHPQLDCVRADAGRFADRSAHGPAESPIDVRAFVARAVARGTHERRSRDDRDGRGRLQDHQRHATATT